MVELPYTVVDVFTDRPLAGNALCVVEGCPDDPAVLQAIAREMNLSETTFVAAADVDGYDVRIFTPASELPFAGHPTLGTAWTRGPGMWTQRSPGATVRVAVDERGAVMAAPDPILSEVYPEEAALALGLREADAPRAFAAEVGGIRHLLVTTGVPLSTLAFDTPALLAAARSFNVTGIAALRPVDKTTLHMRLVVPTEVTTFEDPGTGSAAGPAGVLARRLWDVDVDVVVHQGDDMGRPSRMRVHAEPGDVRVGGDVTKVAHGVLTLG